MRLQSNSLPSRFPVGTRYVVEGRPARTGGLRIQSRYLEFPDGRHMDLPIGRPPPSRRGRLSLPHREPKIIFARAGTK